MAEKSDKNTKKKAPAKKKAVSINTLAAAAAVVPPVERTSEGTFVKGHAPLGPPAELRELRKRLKGKVNQLLVDEFDVFRDCMAKLSVTSPKAYCKVYVDMMAYSLPKISTIAFGADEDSTDDSATALLKHIAQYQQDNKKG